MKKIHFFSLWFVLSCLGTVFWLQPALAEERFKVLVVFSYEENAPWNIEIREEIERVLTPFAELSFFYMDTKKNLAAGEQKGAEAFAHYQQLQPDGVIAVDDNAQSMFVVPYLKDQVSIPIMFCGVNAAPEIYGYPTVNISGILERFHLEESIALSRQLAGDIDTFAFMVKQGPVADLLSEQLKGQKDQFSAELVAVLVPKTMAEALQLADAVRDEADLLFLVALWGVADTDGNKLQEELVIPQLVKIFGKPTTAIAASVVRSGALAAVITNASEHGYRAAEMLLQALRGVPVAQLPITRNYRGKRMINVCTMKNLGIVPDPMVLRGAKLVRSD